MGPAGLSELVRDSGCCQDLNWRCEVPSGVLPETLEGPLEVWGFAARCRHPGLWVFRHPEGHELAWVVASGRLQIRIGIHIPRPERGALAQEFHHHLARLVE